MGVINTLQQLTFNILPQPLTPLMADWLCEAWEPRGWEWHGSILSVKVKADCSAAEPLTPANTVSIRGYFNQRGKDQEILEVLVFAVCLFLSCHQHYLFLPLPFSSHLSFSTVRFACISPSYLPPLQNTLPSTPAVLHNLISSDVFSEQEGTAFHFNQIQAFQKNP